MNSLVIIPGQTFNPLVLPAAKGSAAPNPELASAVPVPTTNDTLPSPSVFTQSLKTLGTLTGAGEAPFVSSFQSALQAKSVVSSLLTTPSVANAPQGSSTQNPASLTSLLLQALSAEDAGNTSGEIPFIAPYQLGLQATMDLASLIQTPSQTSPAQPGATQNKDATTPPSQDLTQTLNPLDHIATLPGTADVVTLGVADPTSSSLFQSHAGALAPNPLLALSALGSGLTETPATMRVMETHSSAATSAFSEGRPLNSNVYVMNAATPGSLSLSPSTGSAPAGGVAPTYSPQGIPIVNTKQIGTFLDLTE